MTGLVLILVALFVTSVIVACVHIDEMPVDRGSGADR